MAELLEVLRFELRYRLRQPVFYVFAAVFFFMAFGAISTDSVQIVGGIGNVARNSPFVITRTLIAISMAATVLVTILMASAVNRDRELGTEQLFFVTPLSKLPFLAGRFIASVLLATASLGGAVVGIVLASSMPWQDPAFILPFDVWPYVKALAIFVLPNLLLSGAVLFSVAVLSGRAFVTYVFMIGFLSLWGFSRAFLGDLQNQFLAALADPFGFSTFDLVTRYWTIVERNTQTIPLEGSLLANRLLWTVLALGLVAVTVLRYRMTVDKTVRSDAGGSRDESSKREDPVTKVQPAVTLDFSIRARSRQWLDHARMEIKGVVRSVPFLVLLLFGLVNMLGNLLAEIEIEGTNNHPVTHAMLSHIAGGFDLFLLLVIALYSAELVWKERRFRVHEVQDGLPVPNWIILSAKMAALASVAVVALALAMFTTIAYQAAHGYTHFEMGLYFKGLFLIALSSWLLLIVLSVFVQVASPNKYVGYLWILIYFIAVSYLPSAGYEHRLYLYGTTPAFLYSDMNAYGPYGAPVFWFSLYWAFGAAALAIVTNRIWRRGADESLRRRLKAAGRNWGARHAIGLAVCSFGFLALGGWIFYNTNVLNDYRPGDEESRRKALFEARYKQYEDLTQPRLTEVSLSVDMFPESRSILIQGDYRLVNRSERAIETLHLHLNPALEVRRLNVPGAVLEQEDAELGYRIYRLQAPMDLGESVDLDFELAMFHRGFVNNDPDTEIVRNGTFFHNLSHLPGIGYCSLDELEDPSERKKHGLSPVRLEAAPEDTARLSRGYISGADRIRFEARVSTNVDQIAVAPGRLEREWTDGNRRYFHYKMDVPILNFYAFLSGDYEVARDRWRELPVEVYYHRDHPYNVDRMIEAVKDSLTYFTGSFGPYPYRQARIVEFPRYREFAQSFPGMVPYSEGAYFISDLRNEENLDLVYWLTAHEMAHQWWAHQVYPADVLGANMVAESLAQYSALMVIEKSYGRNQMRKFLGYELDHYLKGRGQDWNEERPLVHVGNQAYIYYAKGSLAMYALREYLGEEPLNAALRRYLEATAFQGPPYTHSLELVAYLREATPERYRYLIEDMFETITLYDNRTERAAVTRAEDGRYQVKLSYLSRKLRSDGRGVENEIEHRDWIEVGVFGRRQVDGKTESHALYLEKHRLESGTGEVEIVVDEEPFAAGVDPRNLLVDRVPDDNLARVGGW
jgi:ABC-type transport system involved in multi-copper enzyme maturation permease subunit